MEAFSTPRLLSSRFEQWSPRARFIVLLHNERLASKTKRDTFLFRLLVDKRLSVHTYRHFKGPEQPNLSNLPFLPRPSQRAGRGCMRLGQGCPRGRPDQGLRARRPPLHSGGVVVANTKKVGTGFTCGANKKSIKQQEPSRHTSRLHAYHIRHFTERVQE